MMVSSASITCASAALISGAMAEIFLPSISRSPLTRSPTLASMLTMVPPLSRMRLFGSTGLLAVEAANIVGERGAGKPVAGGRACGKRGAGLERTAARHAHVTRHGRSSLGFYKCSDHSSAVARKYSLRPGLILGTKSSSTFMRPAREFLLVEMAHQRVQRRPAAFDRIVPDLRPEDLARRLDLVDHPRQADGQRVGVVHPVIGDVARPAEGAIEADRQPGVLPRRVLSSARRCA